MERKLKSQEWSTVRRFASPCSAHCCSVASGSEIDSQNVVAVGRHEDVRVLCAPRVDVGSTDRMVSRARSINFVSTKERECLTDWEPEGQSSKKELLVQKKKTGTVDNDKTQQSIGATLSVADEVLGCTNHLSGRNACTGTEFFEFPKYVQSATQPISQSSRPPTVLDSVETDGNQSSSTEEIEVYVYVLGSKFYDCVLQSVVVLNVDGSAINMQLGIRDELEYWSVPRVVNLRVGEGITIKMTIKDDTWSVPDQELTLAFPHTNGYFSFGIISPEPHKVLGICIVKPTHHNKPIGIPFFPPHMSRPLPLSRSPSDDRDVYIDMQQGLKRRVRVARDTGLVACARDDTDQDGCAWSPRGSFGKQSQSQLPLEGRVTEDVIDVVARVASDKWREFGRAFGYTRAQTVDILSADPVAINSEKLRMLIDHWLREGGHKATLKELLRACDSSGVSSAVENKLLKLGRFQRNVAISEQSAESKESKVRSCVLLHKRTSRLQETEHLDTDSETSHQSSTATSIRKSRHASQERLEMSASSCSEIRVDPQTTTDVTDPFDELSSSFQPDQRKPSSIHVDDIHFPREEPQVYQLFEAKYQHVLRATDDFDARPLRGRKCLKSGSFGTVSLYYGVLYLECGDKFDVAIKRLKKGERSRKQFDRELNILTRYAHPNIVRLIGYSNDGPDLCLLYEYMSLGVLSDRLYCKDEDLAIKWHHRLEIGLDVACALKFLHTRCRYPVVHCDVKSSSVYLGAHLQAKLGAFGRAVVGGTTEQQTVRQPSFPRTCLCTPPEMMEGVVSPKGDVHGLGMILVELVTGRPPYYSGISQDLKEYVDKLNDEVFDPSARWPSVGGSSRNFGMELLKIAIVSTTKDYVQRPDVTEILLLLRRLAELAVQYLDNPGLPGGDELFIPSRVNSTVPPLVADTVRSCTLDESVTSSEEDYPKEPGRLSVVAVKEQHAASELQSVTAYLNCEDQTLVNSQPHQIPPSSIKEQTRMLETTPTNSNSVDQQYDTVVAQAGPHTFERYVVVPNPPNTVVSLPTMEAMCHAPITPTRPRNKYSIPPVHNRSNDFLLGTVSLRRTYGSQLPIGSLSDDVSDQRRPVLEKRQEKPDNPPAKPSEARQPVDESPDENKKELVIHPIFEAKYYHVERSTDHFNDRPVKDGGKRLGSGSFGSVYYGILQSESGDKFEVAIKRLKKASSLTPAQVEVARKQFGTEMNILTRYLHRNIVQLIGFSSDGPEMCLIYEYMKHGALSDRLGCKDGSPPLKWRVRLTIAKGVASGIDFLHDSYHQAVIHRDVTSSNVLIDAQFEAKLSDFGLAILAGNASFPSVGTRSYVAPEELEGLITTKVDVYGFGMILYELATGLSPYSSKTKHDLKMWIDNICRRNEDLTKMLDPKAKFPTGKSERYGLELLEIAQVATIENHGDRPSIRDILSQLKQLFERATTMMWRQKRS